MTPLQQLAADHQFLLAAVADATGLADPVAFDPAGFLYPLLKNSTRGPRLPLAGTLIHHWSRSHPWYYPGVRFGARVYRAGGIRFVRAFAEVDDDLKDHGYDFFAVSRADYLPLFRLALRFHRASQPPDPPPVLDPKLFATVRQNTVDFLDPKNLKRVRELGGRPKRGLLFTGPPGNGKTSACRWVLQQCTALGYETKQVTPDDYRAARNSCNPAGAVKELFRVTGRGVVFFDDMDLALQDRDATDRPEDQAVFLGALDGIEANEGVVYVFTTNLPVGRIDPAFRRPGRLDLVVPFPKPDAALRRALVDRWHPDVRAGVDLAGVVADTDGLSFAEIEELKNLLVLSYVDAGGWDWPGARRRFEANRGDMVPPKPGPFGFLAGVAPANGHGLSAASPRPV